MGTATPSSAAPVGAVKGCRVIGFGDSITAGGNAVSFFDLACILSNQRFRHVANLGVAGNSSTDMVARLETAVAYAGLADYAIVLGGTNDIQIASTDTTIANLTTICSLLAVNGITPIMCTIPPHNGYNVPQIIALNLWIRYYAAKMGYHCVDFFAALVDPSNSNFVAAYSDDGLHPNYAGARVMANLLLTNVLPRIGAEPVPLAATNSGDTANKFSNPLFMNVTGSDPTGWALQSGSETGTITHSVTTNSLVLGKVWQFACTTAGGAPKYGPSADTSLASIGSIGDTIIVSGKILTLGNADAGSLDYDVTVQFLTSGLGGIGSIVSLVKGAGPTPRDIADGAFYRELVIPATTAWVRFRFAITSGSGTVQLGQVCLRNKTTAITGGLPA